VYTLNAGIESIVVTPASRILRILTFNVEGNDILELANPVAFIRMTARGDFDGDGHEDILVDKHAILTRNGKLKIVYHGIGSK
jgi:hypothetical protein